MKRSALCAGMIAMLFAITGTAVAAETVRATECSWGGTSSGPNTLYLRSWAEASCDPSGSLSVAGSIAPINPLEHAFSNADASLAGAYTLAAPASRLNVVSIVDVTGTGFAQYVVLGSALARVSVVTEIRHAGCAACHVKVTREVINTSLDLFERSGARIVSTVVATNTDGIGALIPAGDLTITVRLEGAGEANGVLSQADFSAQATLVRITANPIV